MAPCLECHFIHLNTVILCSLGLIYSVIEAMLLHLDINVHHNFLYVCICVYEQLKVVEDMSGFSPHFFLY